MVDLLENKARAVLVGTATGVMVSFLSKEAHEVGRWQRLGGCAEFPLVLNAGLSYEHYSDTLVAATMGRGVYTMKAAKERLLDARSRVMAEHSGFDVNSGHRVPEASDAKWYPAQHA